MVFQPSNQRPYFEDVMQVYVPNQQEELLVAVRGRCWEEGVFLTGPAYHPAPEDPFMEQQLALAADRAAGLPTPAPPVRELTLDFPHAVHFGEVATATIEVGSLKSAAAGGAAGEFVLDELPLSAKEAGWSVEPGRLPLAVGEKKPVQVRYAAPAAATAGLAAYFGHEERIELTLGALLKGGLPAPPTSEGRRLSLVFRALLRPSERPADMELPSSITRAGDVAAAAAAAPEKKGKK